VCSVWKCAS
jgi:hypothetical protein